MFHSCFPLAAAYSRSTTSAAVSGPRRSVPPGAPTRLRVPFVQYLPYGPEAPPAARRACRTLLDGWDVPADVVDDALLIVSELVTNAVRHALPPVTLLVSAPADGAARVEVADGGPRGTRPPAGADDGGRGLDLVCALARAHGTVAGAPGTTSWAEVAWSTPGHRPVR